MGGNVSDTTFSGKAYHEGVRLVSSLEGFVGVDQEAGGISIACYAYDQGIKNDPASISVELSIKDARAYARLILAGCDEVEAGW